MDNTNRLIIMENMISKLKPRRFQLKDQTREWLSYCIGLICAFLFLATAYSKIAEHERFLKGLSRVTIIGSFAVYISWLVPVSEILVAVLLIIPQTCKYGLYGFTGLMTLFTGYILSMVLWAEKLPCHCGAAIETLSWTQHIGFNLAFIILAIWALRLSKIKFYL